MALDVSTRIVRRGPPVPTRLTADLCVLGSGAAGFSAALEAARLGRRVVLVEGAPQLGGQAVGSMIGTFCGLYSNGPNPLQVTHGIADDLLRDLRASGDAKDIRGRRNTIIVQYRVAGLLRWIETRVRNAGIDVLLGAVLRTAHRDGRRIERLEFATRHGDVEVVARGFIDASGDAALAWQAGLACREPTQPIYGTMMFAVEGHDELALARLDRNALRARLAEEREAYGLLRHDGVIFASAGLGEVLINMTHIETPLDPLGASHAVLEGHAQVDALMKFLRAEFPDVFAHARVRTYAQPGIRQTRGIVGGYQLAAADVRNGTCFDDAVARCSWPIEFHDRAEEAYWEEFGDGHMHYVPFRSLTPVEADNLVTAGRCIDADPVALSSVRVMGPCMAMGAAAAHALDLAGAGSVHQIDMAALKERLHPNLASAE